MHKQTWSSIRRFLHVVVVISGFAFWLTVGALYLLDAGPLMNFGMCLTWERSHKLGTPVHGPQDEPLRKGQGRIRVQW